MANRPSLRTELLLNLAFLAAVALLLGVVSVLLLNNVAPERVLVYVLVVVGADVAIFIVFGHYLVTRLVLRPMAAIVRTADAVAAGNLDARAPDAETREFADLATRLNRMTDFLVDAQGQLVRSEKLASVGRMASGIAHEVGNPLGAVGTYVDVLRRRGGDAEILDGIRRELSRIDAIVRGLLDYARPGDTPLELVDVATIVRGAYALLEAQGALRTVTARLEVRSNLPHIRARASHLEQAIVNLVLNAVDAAPGGTITLGATAWAWQPREDAPHRRSDAPAALFPRLHVTRPNRPEFRAGESGVLLFVADSGPGVPPEDRSRIFEPFVTTKAPGHGTGLGLAIVARTVDEFGGVIWVDTAREGGAAFKLFFPATAAVRS